MAFPMLLFPLLIVVILLVIVWIIEFKKKEMKPNYYAIFWVGVAWLALGLFSENSILPAVGLIFVVIGLAHKDKWEAGTRWKDLGKKEKRYFLITIVILSVLVVAALIMYYLTEMGFV